MAFKAAQVQELPDKACIGRITEVGDAYMSAKGVYGVLPISIEASFAGQNTTYYFLFRPEFFEPTFDPETILVTDYEDSEGNAVDGHKVYGMYKKFIHDESKTSVLVALTTNSDDPDGFSRLAAAVDKLTPPVDLATVTQILQEHLLGREVGYVLSQRVDRDEDGNKVLTELYQVNYFFPVTSEGLESVLKSANSGRRKRPLVITWPEE